MQELQFSVKMSRKAKEQKGLSLAEKVNVINKYEENKTGKSQQLLAEQSNIRLSI